MDASMSISLATSTWHMKEKLLPKIGGVPGGGILVLPVISGRKKACMNLISDQSATELAEQKNCYCGLSRHNV